MNDEAQLASWWKSLNQEQRLAAHRAAASGHLDDDLRQSLQRDGLLDSTQKHNDQAMPRNVARYLKMRHD